MKKERCTCKVCVYGDIIKGLVDRQTTKADKALVDGLYNRLMNAEEDADYWRIKRHGGFEGLTDEDVRKMNQFDKRTT